MHDVANVRAGAGQQHLADGDHPLEAILIINDIDVVNIIQLFALAADVADRFFDRVIDPDHAEIGGHDTTGCLGIVGQQPIDVFRRLWLQCLHQSLTVRVFEFRHHVRGIIWIEAFDHLDRTAIAHRAEHLRRILLIHFSEDVGSLGFTHLAQDFPPFIDLKSRQRPRQHHI